MKRRAAVRKSNWFARKMAQIGSKGDGVFSQLRRVGQRK